MTLERVEDAIDRCPRHTERVDKIPDCRAVGPPFKHEKHLHHAVDDGHMMGWASRGLSDLVHDVPNSSIDIVLAYP